jgi:uncharacterized YccA/Bax inhibitor family protein
VRSANPTLSDKAFDFSPTAIGSGERTMTVQGTVNRTGVLLLLVVGAAAFTWTSVMNGATAGIMGWVWGGAIAGLVLALVTVFKKTWAPYTSPLYAVAEGLFLGAISAMIEQRFPGIVIQAVSLTFGVAFALLLAYTSGVIKATENFKLGIVAATGGVFLVYMVNMVMGFFGASIPFLHSSGPVGIGISVVIVIIAALNLVLDFDFIENASEQGAPKYMEWYGAFGLVVTLIWLYLEMLRLLAKIQSRD